MKRPEIIDIRHAVNRFLEEAPRGTAARLARTANVNEGALSAFRSDTYRGDVQALARRVVYVLQCWDAAMARMSPEWDCVWLFRTKRDGVKLYRSRAAARRFRNRNPGAHEMQLLLGPELHQMHILETMDDGPHEETALDSSTM